MYRVFVGEDNIDRALILAKGKAGDMGSGASPVMHLLDWNRTGGWLLLSETDDARFIADSFNAKIEHVGYFTNDAG